MTFPRLQAAFGTVLTVAVAVAALSAAPQTQPAGRETSAASVASYRLAGMMPVDPDVSTGTLPNGLRYYVRPNPRPARRVELRLVVKAGSVLEDPDQQGLAHFVEHMQFEGTQNFPKDGINDVPGLAGPGDRPRRQRLDELRRHAYTLRVPSDVPGALDRAMLVLRDWTHAATFDAEAIERQRGIVLSEWRLHLGAQERTRDKIRRTQLAGSRYAIRPPIGDPDVLQKAQRAQLLRFYRDWYRPDLMAVIVVGDVDREEAVAMIKTHFSSLTNPAPKRPRPAFDVPEHLGTEYTIVTDKETTAAAVAISSLRPARPQDTVGGYRQIMLDQLFGDMIDARLDELDQRENPPFLAVGAGRRLFDTPRTKDEVLLQAVIPVDGVARGLDTLIDEIQRVARFGFTATELMRAKQAMMLSYERSVTESPDRESTSRADEYTRNFLQREALPTIFQELAFHRRFIDGITLVEMNALAAQWFPAQNRHVIVTAPETGVALPDQAQLAVVVKTATARRVDRYVDIARRPAPDAVAARARFHREDDLVCRGRHHGMDAVERRDGGAEAHQAEGGPDPLSGVGARRHLGRQRR